MPDRPAARELIEAVFEFLSGELLPTIDDHRLRFRTPAGKTARAIARRELEAGEEGMGEDELRELARRIRAGDVDETLHARLKEHVAEKLRVSNPAYLEKYE